MEHTDSTIPMFVSNLPIENKTLYFVSNGKGKQLLKRKLLSIYNGINRIEEVFIDIIDILVKKALTGCADIEYNIAGGKAINNIIKYKYLSKSFDFDIHVNNQVDIQT